MRFVKRLGDATIARDDGGTPMTLKQTFLCVFALLLSACAAVGPATYGAADEKGFGYQETRIEDDRFRIVYQGSGGMPPEQVEDYAMLRAGELALENGYEWFRVVGRDVSREQRGGVSLGAGVGTGSYGRRSSVGVGVGGNFGKVGAQDYFTVRLEVLLGSGDTPDDDTVYDATSLVSAIGAAASE